MNTKLEKKIFVLSLLTLAMAPAFADGILSGAESGVESAATSTENGVKDVANATENGVKNVASDIDHAIDGYYGPFTGAYVGGQAGVNFSDLDASKTATQNASATALGASAGYNWAVGPTVLGLDAFYGYTGIGHGANYFSQSGYGSSNWGMGLKFGYPYTDKLMSYIKLGYGRLDGTGSISQFSGNGMNGGLGLEYLFAPHWSVTGEWNTMKVYNDFPGANINGQRVDNLINNTFTIGINYYFGAASKPHPVAAAPLPAPVVAEAAPAPAPAPAPTERELIMQETPVHLDGANFKTNSYVLNHTADEKLMQVVTFSHKHPNANVNIDGYTDSTGSKAVNAKLSQNRAEAVKKFLVSHGVSADRIQAVGHGADNPVASNKTAAGRAQNRHVEVSYVVREAK